MPECSLIQKVITMWGKKNMRLPKIERHLPSILLNFGTIWLHLLLIIVFVVAAEKLDHKILDSE